MARIYRLIIIILCLTGTIFAQLPNAFTELAHYDPDNYAIQGKALDVVVDDNSLIYTACGEAGLFVHRLVDSKLEYITHIGNGASYQNLLIAHDGSIISATTSDGVHAYVYQEGQLLEQAIMDTSIRTYRMIQGPDSTIFMANGSYGLFAYKFDGNRFDYITSIDQGGSALGIAMHLDSTIFLGNYYDGIRLYRFNGEEFTLKGHLKLSEDECYDYHAYDITIMNDSTVASCGSQVNVYHYSDSSFYETRGYYLPKTEWDPYNLYNYNPGKRIISKGDSLFISVVNEGLYYFPYPSFHLKVGINYRQATSYGTFLTNDYIFHANEGLGLSVYDMDFTMIDNYSFGEKSTKLEKGPDNLFFIASGSSGIKAYRFEQGTFNFIAEAGIGNDVIDVAASKDGRIVSTVDKYLGHKVYEFSENNFRLIYSKNYNTPLTNAANWVTNYSTEISDDNKLYYGYYYKYVDMIHNENNFSGSFIQVFDIDGTTITADREYFESTRTAPMDIRPAYDDNIFIAYGSQGIKELKHNQVKYNGGTALALDISLDSTLFLANGAGGLRSYAFDTTFHQIAYIDNGGAARGVTTKGVNMVFLANGNDGLRAYIHEDSTFTCQAHLLTDGYAEDVIILPDCTLILVNAYDGLYALSYNGWDSLKTEISKPDPGDNPDQGDDPDIPDSYKLNQNYPNPFNPITTINYQLPSSGDINLVIYDIFGRKINHWSYQNQSVGSYEITWNGKDRSGNPVPSGVYIYRMVAGDFLESKKMVLLK